MTPLLFRLHPVCSPLGPRSDMLMHRPQRGAGQGAVPTILGQSVCAEIENEAMYLTQQHHHEQQPTVGSDTQEEVAPHRTHALPLPTTSSPDSVTTIPQPVASASHRALPARNYEKGLKSAVRPLEAEGRKGYRAAGICLYAWHPVDRQLKLLLLKERKQICAAASGWNHPKLRSGTAALHRGARGEQDELPLVSIDMWNFPGGKREEGRNAGRVVDKGPEATAMREAEEESHWLLPASVLKPLMERAQSHWWPAGKYALFLCELTDAWDLPQRFKAQLKAGKVHPEATESLDMCWMPLPEVLALLGRRKSRPAGALLKTAQSQVRARAEGAAHEALKASPGGLAAGQEAYAAAVAASVPGQGGSTGASTPDLHYVAYHLLHPRGSKVLKWLLQQQDERVQRQAAAADCGGPAGSESIAGSAEGGGEDAARRPGSDSLVIAGLVESLNALKLAPPARSSSPDAAASVARPPPAELVNGANQARGPVLWRKHRPPQPLDSFRAQSARTVLSMKPVRKKQQGAVAEAVREQGGRTETEAAQQHGAGAEAAQQPGGGTEAAQQKEAGTDAAQQRRAAIEKIQLALGKAEVRSVFSIRDGKVAGCIVNQGKVQKGAMAFVLRGGKVVHAGKLTSLRHVKEDVEEVFEGTECGIGIEFFLDWAEGDKVEVHQLLSQGRRIEETKVHTGV